MPAKRDEQFEADFRTLLPRTFALAYRILGDAAAAEDVAAETMARMFAHWRQVRELGHKSAWVYRVAANLAIDQLRRRGAEAHEVARVDIDVEESATLRAALRDALRWLPKRQRETIALRYFAQFTEAEIAAALEVSVGTVKQHIHRGMTSLRSRLGEGRLPEVSNEAD